jgi:hypothetical protein
MILGEFELIGKPFRYKAYTGSLIFNKLRDG